MLLNTDKVVRTKCFECVGQKTSDIKFLGKQKIFQLLEGPCFCFPICVIGENNGEAVKHVY